MEKDNFIKNWFETKDLLDLINVNEQDNKYFADLLIKKIEELRDEAINYRESLDDGFVFWGDERN